eukprot:scaffold3072_cov116-Isochrysis_galbana.AAC.4
MPELAALRRTPAKGVARRSDYHGVASPGRDDDGNLAVETHAGGRSHIRANCVAMVEVIRVGRVSLAPAPCQQQAVDGRDAYGVCEARGHGTHVRRRGGAARLEHWV